MKRITALLLVSILLGTGLCACAKEAPETVPEYDSDIVTDMVYDFQGYEFRLYGTAQTGDVFSLAPVYGDTARGDSILKRYEDVGKELNISIIAQAGVDTRFVSTMYAAGMSYCDLMFVSLADTLANKMIQEGMLNDFTELGLNMNSGKYGTDEMIKAVTFKDGVYGFIANYWGIPVFHAPHAIWFNPGVLNTYSQTSPHELDEQGLWDWEHIEDICRNVFDNTDPDKNNWIYGMVYTSEQYLELSAIYSNGGRLAQIDENTGRLVYALNSPNTIEAMEWLASMQLEGIIKDGGDRQNITPFMENKYAFFIEYPWMGVSTEGGPLAIQMEDPYEWITFPIGPSGTPGSCPNVISYHSRFLFSPIGADTEILPVAMEKIFEPLDGEEESLWYDNFSRLNFYSEKSFEYFLKMRNEAFWDYSSYTPFTDSIRNALTKIITNKGTASQELQSIEGSVQEIIDDRYNAYLD